MIFNGWKLKSGEVVRHFNSDETGQIYIGEHEANKLRELLNYKGRMTPQYNK